MRWSRKVTFWDHEVTKRKKGKTYTVRWTVERKKHREPFHSKTAADAYKSELMVAHGSGEKFDIESGLPQSKLKQQNELTWYELTLKYTDMRWPHLGGRQRQSIAEGLSYATTVMLKPSKQRPSDDEIRAALMQWAFGDRLHGDELPPTHKEAIAWLEGHSVNLADLEDEQTGPGLVHGLLDHLSRRLDGKPAAANYFTRRRRVVNTMFKYANEIHALRSNPFESVTWKMPEAEKLVDPAVVPNHDQIVRLLEEVGKQGQLGERLETFFAVMAYAGLRPEEVIALRRENLTLPLAAEDNGKQFGEFHLRRAEPHAIARYNDDRSNRHDRRRLKHRSEKTVRVVPIHPRLVKRLRVHLERFGYGRDGRLFVGPRGGIPSQDRYGDTWQGARKEGLTATELERGIARAPYNLRHACVSGWLAAGVDPAQVAEWAGHSVETLLRIYAKCLDGNAERAKKLILESLPAEDEEPVTASDEDQDGGGEGGQESDQNLTDEP